MRAGDTIGPWTLVEPSIATNGGSWWQATDETGRSATVLVVEGAQSVADTLARYKAIAASHLAQTWAPTSVYQDGPRALLAGPSLDPRSPERLQGPEAVGIVAAIGATLLGVLIEAEPGVTEGFSPADLVFNTDGRLLLAPRPRQFDGTGSTPDGTAGKALGAWLYKLATGADPAYNPARPGPPPSPSTLRPDLPPELDQAIMSLLADDPLVHAAALAQLHDLATPLPDLRRLVRTAPALKAAVAAPPPLAQVQYTTTPDTSPDQARVDSASGTLLVLAADQTAALTPSQRSEVAGRLGLPMSLLQEEISARAVLPIGARVPKLDAQKAADKDPLPAVVLAPPGFVVPTVALASTTIGLATAALGGLLTLATLGLGLPVVALGLVIGAAGAAVGGWWWSSQRRYTKVTTRWASLTRHAAAANTHPLVGSTRARLAALRRTVAQGHLPETAAVDVRAGLDEVDSDLDALAAAWDSEPQAAPRERLRAKQTGIEAGLIDLATLLSSATIESTEGVGTAVHGLLVAARNAVEAVNDPIADKNSAAERARRAHAQKNSS